MSSSAKFSQKINLHKVSTKSSIIQWTERTILTFLEFGLLKKQSLACLKKWTTGVFFAVRGLQLCKLTGNKKKG
jgi:hypothetical protein